MPPNDHNRLYRILVNRICERIFRGDYRDGNNLPPERVLAESLEVSRVTVRKAMALLETDGIIERVQGSGNRISLPLAGYPGTMDIIAVLAHAQNVFFSSFIDHFQRTAESSDSLVLFKQILPGERLEEGLFKLLQKGIRNAVIWLEDQQVDMEAIRRLRGLGMNMVFFDDVISSPYADGVLLDNRDAIRTLHRCLTGRGVASVGYIGWENNAVLSAKEREEAFLRQEPAAAFIHKIAWHDRKNLSGVAAQLAENLKSAGKPPEGIICGDGEIGVAIRKALISRGLAQIDVASPDEYPESCALSITVYRQDFQRMAEKTYACLAQQNQPPWVAATYRIKGALELVGGD